MPQIYHQSVEEILKAATPEQKILWNFIFLRFGERIAISQLHFSGGVAGEIGIYSANKIYLAYQIAINGQSSVQATGSYLQFYNETNASKFIISNNAGIWDATAAAARYINNSIGYNNIWFSRVAIGGISTIEFIGYRIMI